MLHRLAELDGEVREAYAAFDYKRVVALLNDFMTTRPVGLLFRRPQGRALLRPDLEPAAQERADGDRRDRSARVATWLAPILAFTAEEAWLARYPDGGRLGASRDLPGHARRLARRGARGAVGEDPPRAPRRHRRARDRAGAKAHRREPRGGARGPCRRIESCCAALEGVDLAEICITSGLRVDAGRGPGRGLPPRRRQGRRGRAALAQGRKCARSWKISTEVGADPDYPDVTPRDAAGAARMGRRRGAAAEVTTPVTPASARLAVAL